ncbi:MAG: hypothetical protein KAS32_10155 [Candidatus Peribacteraceae bacterium]|nr:hypothetical protein [Candidatus Peribacteraceae bacterium]
MLTRSDVKIHVFGCLRSGAFEQSGDEVYMQCPGCGDDDRHFSVNVSRFKFNCYRCDVGGSLASLFADSGVRREFSGLVTTPKGRVEKGTSTFAGWSGEPIHDILFSETERKLGKYLRGQAAQAFNYCRKRGMSHDQIRKYQVSIQEYVPRAFFPCWDEDGKPTFYMGRLYIDDTDQKKTLEPIDSEKPLFGRHIKKYTDWVIIVEGVFDHLVTPRSYAMMGSSLSFPQLKILQADGIKRVFIVMDPDAHGKAQNIAKRTLQFGIRSYPVEMGTTDDPGKLGPKVMGNLHQALSKLSPNKRPQVIRWLSPSHSH